MIITKLSMTVIDDKIKIDTVHSDAQGAVMTDTDLLIAIRNHVYNLFTRGIKGEASLNFDKNEMLDEQGNPVPQHIEDHFHQLSTKKEH